MEVRIDTESINLGQFLKFLGLLGTGGQAKAFLAENTVLVNGVPTGQRGKKIFPGDVVQVNKAVYRVIG